MKEMVNKLVNGSGDALSAALGKLTGDNIEPEMLERALKHILDEKLTGAQPPVVADTPSVTRLRGGDRPAGKSA